MHWKMNYKNWKMRLKVLKRMRLLILWRPDLIELEDLLDQLRKTPKALRYDYEKNQKNAKAGAD